MIERTQAPIVAHPETKTLEVPHRGVSLRVLQAAAAANSQPGTRPRWTLMYKGTVIGELRLHTIPERKRA